MAPLTVAASKVILNAKQKLDELPSWAKQATVIVVASLITAASAFLGVQLTPDGQPPTLDNLSVSALISGLLAFVLHNGLKKDKK